MGGHVFCWLHCLDGLLGCRLKRELPLLTCISLFGIHQWALHTQMYFTWIDSYLDPLLFLPIALGLAGWAVRIMAPAFQWNGPFIFLAWAAGSIAFEAWIPAFDDRFTSDLYDVLAYGFGALLFYGWSKIQRRALTKKIVP